MKISVFVKSCNENMANKRNNKIIISKIWDRKNIVKGVPLELR